MRRNKPFVSGKSRKNNALWLGLFFSLLVIFIIIATLFYLAKVITSSDYFTIKEVLTRTDTQIDCSYLEGRNIFAIDLRKESEQLRYAHPNYKSIKLIRILPDRLYVEFSNRNPLAIVKLYKFFYVDKDLVLFEVPPQFNEFGLPLILGLDTKIFGVKPGRVYHTKELILALEIIQGISRNRAFLGYRLRKIEINSLANIGLLFVSEYDNRAPENERRQLFSFEVKISSEHIKDKLNLLADLISQNKDKLANVKYVDLRFTQPVIKFNDDKQ